MLKGENLGILDGLVKRAMVRLRLAEGTVKRSVLEGAKTQILNAEEKSLSSHLKDMRVIIFLGHHKVGTSSLQEYLSQNYHQFLAEGVLYPMTEPQGLTVQMGRALKSSRSGAKLPFNVREAHNALGFRMLAEGEPKGRVPAYHGKLPGTVQMFNAVHRQISEFRPHTVVLCAEVFANFSTRNDELITRLRNEFSQSRVTIMGTLRRPDDYVASWQGQRFKFGHKLKPLHGSGLDEYFDTIHFNYQMMLQGWADVFPESSGHTDWILRDHSAVMAAGGSVPDFLNETKISPPLNGVITQDSNPSVPLALHEVAREGNCDLEAQDAKDLVKFLVGLGKRVKLTPNSAVEMFGSRKRTQLVERFEPINHWIAETVGAGQFFAHEHDFGVVREVTSGRALSNVMPALRNDAQKQGLSDPVRRFLDAYQVRSDAIDLE
jgi:hypothetical protein